MLGLGFFMPMLMEKVGGRVNGVPYPLRIRILVPVVKMVV